MLIKIILMQMVNKLYLSLRNVYCSFNKYKVFYKKLNIIKIDKMR